MPVTLPFIEVPEFRSPAALLANLRKVGQRMLAADRGLTEPKVPEWWADGIDAAEREQRRKEADQIMRRWTDQIGSIVVQAMRFTGTTWTPKYDELAVAVLKWAAGVLEELVAAEAREARLDQQVEGLVSAASEAQRRHTVAIAERDRAVAELTATLDAMRAEVRIRDGLIAASEKREDALTRDLAEARRDAVSARTERDAWKVSAEAAASSAASAECSLQLLQAALRIPDNTNTSAMMINGAKGPR